MATTLYLRGIDATGVVPNAKQSADTITDDLASTWGEYATPAQMTTTAGSANQTNSGTVAASPNPRYEHYGTWVSPAMAGGQQLSGTVTIGLSMNEARVKQNVLPRVYIYLWNADDTIGSDVLAVVDSATEVGVAYALATYFSGTAISTVDVAEGDRIVIEIEGNCDPTESVSCDHGIQFDGAAAGTYGSYVTFSDDILWYSVGGVATTDVNAVTTDTFNLKNRAALNTTIDALTTTTMSAGQRHATSCTSANAVTTTTFGVGQTAALAFTVDALSTVTDLLGIRHSVATEVNSVTTTSFTSGISQALAFIVNALSSITDLDLHQALLHALGCQVDALSITDISLSVTAGETEVACEVNAVSATEIELTKVGAATLVLTAVQHETHIDLTWVAA